VLQLTPTAQLRQSFRVVSPAEYDYASRRASGLCPHVLFGDCRSGQQLLNAARADAKMGMEQLRQTSRGRALLEKTIFHMQTVVEAAEDISSPHPLSYASMLCHASK
jgi:hypothetical protein